METAAIVSRYIVNAQYHDLPVGAVNATKQHILHTLATILGGSDAPGCKIVVDQVKDWGGVEESTVLVYGGKVPAVNAALGNATMAHALDFCMNDDRTYYKSSVSVVPACIAVAEKLNKTGKELLTGICLGIELGVRLALAINPRPAHGLSPAIGSMAAAAGVGKIMELDEEKMLDALGISLSQVSGLGSATISPSLTKRLGRGLIARGGLFAASLAAKGFKGSRNVLQGAKGYYCAVHGTEGDQQEITSDWGSRFELINVFPKGYPCCRRLHAPVEAALGVADETDIKIEDIVEVIVEGAAREIFPPGSDADPDAVSKRYRPQSQVDAQFSVPWGVATALLKKKIAIEDFSEPALSNPEVIELMDKVTLASNPELESKDEMMCPAVVTVKMQNGRTFSRRVDFPKGNRKHPVSYDETKKVFRGCAAYTARRIPEKNIEPVIKIIDTLESTKDMRWVDYLLPSS